MVAEAAVSEKTEVADRLEIRVEDFHLLSMVPAGSAHEIAVTQFLEFLRPEQRIEFFNQAYRILTDDGQLLVTVPYHSHPRAFANPRIQWPPFSEHSFLFLDKEWREGKPERNVPALTCDFPVPPVATFSYGYDDMWSTRSTETISFALEHYLGVCVELYVCLPKRVGGQDAAQCNPGNEG